MREISRPDGHTHFTDETLARLYEYDSGNPEATHPKIRPDLVLKCFTQRRLFRELLAVWDDKAERKFVILETHANYLKRNWVYGEINRKLRTVQSFVDRFDGRCTAIMLLVCNPNNTTIHSTRSLILHPNKSLNLPTALNPGHMRLFVPGHGYLENDYKKLRNLIDSLRAN